MKKDLNWLRRKVLDNKFMGHTIHIDVLFELMDELDEPEVLSQELPVIPKFVADFLTGKEGYSISDLFNYNFLYDANDKIAEWLYDNDEETNKERELSLILAHYGGYTVEEEQKYVVELPNPNNQMGRHKNVFLNKKDGKVFIDSASLFVNDITKYGQFALTEEEIKKDFEWAWKFAKPVEELEE